jgi:hypothetical protein
MQMCQVRCKKMDQYHFNKCDKNDILYVSHQSVEVLLETLIIVFYVLIYYFI